MQIYPTNTVQCVSVTYPLHRLLIPVGSFLRPWFVEKQGLWPESKFSSRAFDQPKTLHHGQTRYRSLIVVYVLHFFNEGTAAVHVG